MAQGEFAENEVRKDFTASERVAIAEALWPIEEAKAKERLKESGSVGGQGLGNFPDPSQGRTRDKVAAFTGTSGKTLEKATAVVQAAREDPEKFGKYHEAMDKTNRVDGAYRKVRAIQKFEALPDTPPLETVARFGVVVACFLAPLRVSKKCAD